MRSVCYISRYLMHWGKFHPIIALDFLYEIFLIRKPLNLKQFACTKMMDNLFFFGLRGYGEQEICSPLKAAQTSHLLALGWRRILLYYSYRLLISARCSEAMESHLQRTWYQLGMRFTELVQQTSPMNHPPMWSKWAQQSMSPNVTRSKCIQSLHIRNSKI